MVVLGLDAASTTGWALVERTPSGHERVLKWGTVDGRDHRVRASLARVLAPKIVVIEDAWLGAGSKANPKVLKTLARIQGGWEQAVRDAGAEVVEYMQPHAWQSALLSGLCRGNAPRAERKAAAVLWAKRWHAVIVPEDAADALGLATWGARTMALSARAIPG